MSIPRHTGLAIVLGGLNGVEAAIGGIDIAPSTLRVLLAVWQHEGATISGLAKEAGTAPNVTSRAVAILGRGPQRRSGLGLVETQEDPGDRREKRVCLTTAGKAARKRAEDNALAALSKSFKTVASG